MAKKKVAKKPAKRIAKQITDEQRELLLKLINSSSDVLRDVLEVGSAMANDCLETQSAIHNLAKEFNFKQGDEIQIGDQKVRFVGVDKTPEHPSYEEKEGDIAISAIMEVENVNGDTFVAKPMYFIRDNKPYQLKYETIHE